MAPGSTVQEAPATGDYPSFADIPVSQQEAAPWYSWLFYTWVSPLLTRGSDRMTAEEALKNTDLYRLPSFEDPGVVGAQLREKWDEEMAAFEAFCRAHPEKYAAAMAEAEGDTVKAATAMGGPQPSLARALRRAFWKRVALGGAFRLLSDGTAFAAPYILRELVRWFADPTAADYVGFVFAAALVVSNVVMSISMNAATHHTSTGFQQMACAAAVMVYDGSFAFRHNHGKSGNLLAAHANDSFKLVELAMFIHGVWLSPLLVVGAVISIYVFIGWAGFVAIGLMILSIPLQSVLMGLVFRFRGAQVKVMDRRVGRINEALQGIRVCKFMGWEPSFAASVDEARDEEVAIITKSYLARMAAAVVTNNIHQLVTLALFAIAYAASSDNITTEKVFPALSMLNVVRIPLLFIPMSIAKIFEVKISVLRLQSILMERGRVVYAKTEPADPAAPAVEVRNVTVMGDGNQPLAPRLNVKLARGKLTMVVGATGSGKSTLVSAIIGEADVDAETVARDGSAVVQRDTVAYVPQDAWIMNATLRENILMGASYDEVRYLDTLEACQLLTDLSQLPGSDQTDIGERGINLSGGQKQRIALARAVYSGKGTVVMDDPLSAVDPHVCEGLFHGCLLGDSGAAGMQDRTRLLVTHQTQFLPYADRVIVMHNCRIAFDGTVEELRHRQSDILNGLADPAPTEPLMAAGGSPDEEPGSVASINAAVAAVSVGAKSDSQSPPRRSAALPGASSSQEVAPPARVIPPAKDNTLMTAEESHVGDVAWSTYGWYALLGGPLKLVLVVVMCLLWSMALVAFNYILARWAGGEAVLGYRLSGTGFIIALAAAFGVGLLALLVRQVAFAFFSVSVAGRSHSAMIHNVLRAPTWFFDTTPQGRIMNRFTKDMEAIDTRIPDTLLMALNIGFSLISTIVLVGIAIVYLLVIFPVLIFVFHRMYKYYTQTLRGVKRLDGTARSPMVSMMSETIGGLSSIRAFGIVDDLKAEHIRRVQRAMVPSYCVRACQRWLSARTEMFGSFVVLCTAIFGAVAKITDGHESWAVGFTPAVSSLAITYALSMTNGVTFMTRTMADFESDMSSVERVKEYSDDIPQERDVVYDDNAEGTAPLKGKADADAKQPLLQPPPAKSWPSDGALSFRDVQLRYREGLPLVLRGVSFEVGGGQKVGIVGRTGSGKSTLMLAIFRMVELAGGSISLCGRDVATLRLADLRSQITIIPQDPVLFGGTVRTNLDPFGTRTDEELWAAIDRVRLRRRLEEGAASDDSATPKKGASPTPAGVAIAVDDAEPRGLESPVLEKGSNFSVGQRQLLCLARALLKKSRVLLLDEATASVDLEADAMIQETLRTAFADCTVLTIAHRLATVVDTDKVLVLGAGEVLEFDRPSVLLARPDSDFRGMAEKLGEDTFAALQQSAAAADSVRPAHR